MFGLILTAAAAASHSDSVSVTKALESLDQGNRRFVQGKPIHPHTDIEVRSELAKSQHPFAIVVGCADSRVSPELVFDQGIGDLFVVRTAGNLVDDFALGSIEYAVQHLGASLIVVLGHERCGAVKATVDFVDPNKVEPKKDEHAGHEGDQPHYVFSLLEAIRPAVEKSKYQPGDRIHNAVIENVKQVSWKVTNCKGPLGEAIRANKVRIIGGCYDLDTGKVDWTK